MNHVSHIRGPQALPPTERGGSNPPTPAPPARLREHDQADISVIARLRAQMASLPDVRQNVIDRVRAEIDAGSYESADKIEAAIDALMEDL